MLSEELKLNTKQQHQILEKKMLSKMKLISNEQEYAALLSLFYSFFGGIELSADKYIDLTILPDYYHRRKSAALAFDLSELSKPLPELALRNDLPEIRDHLQCIGALYVMEGSTLGGKVIAKMMLLQLEKTEMPGLSFFNGYGDQTMIMWQKFKQSIDMPLSATEAEIIIKSANDTFLRFSNWFDKHENL